MSTYCHSILFFHPVAISEQLVCNLLLMLCSRVLLEMVVALPDALNPMLALLQHLFKALFLVATVKQLGL